MRKFLDIIEHTLFESRGLGARTAGEEFISTTNPNDKIFLQDVKFYPSKGGQYNSPTEVAVDVQKITKSLKNNQVDVIGNFKSNDLAFGVATFNTPDGQLQSYIKPFRSINPDPSQNPWSNQTGIPGYRYNSKVAAKSQAGLMPQDILTQSSNLSPKDIVSQIAEKFGIDSPLTIFAAQVAQGTPFPITMAAPSNVEFTAFTNYFCELLHPISLLVGTSRGNADDAAIEFLGPTGFTKASISFGMDKTEGLSDSIITNPEGGRLKVSSKAAAGAQASAKNLLDLSRESKQVGSKDQKEVLQVIDTVIRSGAKNAPLVLGKYYNIISEKDDKAIQDLAGKPLISLKAANKLPLSKNLKSLMNERSTANTEQINLYFHLVAAVAHKVADHINDTTEFSAVASKLLNNGALVQVYTKAKQQGSNWIINSFDAQWPSTATTGVKFSAAKNYYSTGIKGNFTFKILRNGAKDIEDDTDIPTVDTAIPASDVTDYEAPRSNLKAADTVGVKKSTPAADEKKFGRAKQR